MKKIVLIFKYSGSEKSSNNLLKNMYLTYVGLFWSCNTRFLKGGGWKGAPAGLARTIPL